MASGDAFLMPFGTALRPKKASFMDTFLIEDFGLRF
jgi:hypothetical protein